jgi:cytochrome P450
MKRVKEELNEVIGESQFVDRAILGQLCYLNSCLSESLRLYPPFPIVRECMQDAAISCNDSTIQSPLLVKQGTIAMIHNFALHRTPEYFPDPLQFIPERWLNEANQSNSDDQESGSNEQQQRPEAQSQWKPKPWSYLPFGGGSRTCVGQNFALLQSRLVLIELLRAFEFEATNEPEPSLALTMKYKGGLRVSIQTVKKGIEPKP